MNQEELEIVLEAAKESSFLKPNETENICFVKYLNTANKILWLLQESSDSGLSTSQLCDRTGFNKNTCICYLRCLFNLGLVQREDRKPQETIWFYFDKKIQSLQNKQKVKDLLDTEMHPKAIAEELGLSLSRVYQIRDYWRQKERLRRARESRNS